MSFAKEVKKEISNLEVDISGLKAELYGYIKLKKELIISNQTLNLEIKSDSLPIIRRLVMIIKKIYNFEPEIKLKKRNNLDKKNMYFLSLGKKTYDVLIDLKIIDFEYNYIENINTDFNGDSIIRGMFLARGSINDPTKSYYHLEIACTTSEESSYICRQLEVYGLNAKVVLRDVDMIVYLKKAEQIGDFLKIIGAVTTLFDFENERIRRDLNNVINRIINCDIANSEKTQKVANKQLKQIEYIEKVVGFETLPVRLMEVATLRIKMPDSSLQELSDISEECIGHYLSKSGINHCFRDLEIFYLSLLEEQSN